MKRNYNVCQISFLYKDEQVIFLTNVMFQNTWIPTWKLGLNSARVRKSLIQELITTDLGSLTADSTEDFLHIQDRS
jgi:hypothetical protein